MPDTVKYGISNLTVSGGRVGGSFSVNQDGHSDMSACQNGVNGDGAPFLTLGRPK